MRSGRLILAAVALVSVVAALVVAFGVRLNPDIVALLPARGDAAVLSRYLRGFGGGGVGVVLLEGEDPADVQAAADSLAAALANDPTVAFSASHIQPGERADPLLSWRAADATARAKLAQALTPEGMQERLAETRKLLLAPGSGSASDRIAADPLRLAEIAYGERSIGAGVTARADGYFATEEGKAHLVVVKPRGQALKGADAKAFVAAVDRALEDARRAHPTVTIRLTGPHAVAAGMEAMLRRDLTRSGVVSLVLASLAFALVFRRLRALAAIVPPLALGTLWTGAVAAAWPGGISAIAVAFTSIVVGVGFDTGVHVYAAVLDARREGLAPEEAARVARRRTARPVLVAATIASVAFASLALSSVDALAQLGLLCAAGELLTAVAIVLATPELAALLERGAPPAVTVPFYTRAFAALTATKRRAAVALLACLLAGASVFVTGVQVSDSLVAIRPKSLEALKVEDRIFELFGGKDKPWIVLVADADRDAAMTRADRIAERLVSDDVNVARVDALTSLLPSNETQRSRFSERDALDLPAKAAALEAALGEARFSVPPFEPFLEAMRKAPSDIVPVEQSLEGDLAVVASRYLGHEGGEHLVALHVQLNDVEGARAAMDRDVHDVDPSARITGYARLEADLKAALTQDLPRIGGVAAGLVLVLLIVSLRRARDVVLALGVLVVGLGALFGVVGALGVPLHLYSALVIPVLLGISVDEAMFLLHHGNAEEAAGTGDPIVATIRREAPPVITTALTTSAGLLALVAAQYEGLRDLGIMGSVGNAANLVVALLLVPAGLRLTMRAKQR
ncbi:MAG: MMPL family transporter [Polyangiaceae bacterium]|nr:MMPL family transporter [Polyangiaceae bacterium]MBK8941993.1 MMPL family transporter [Polyangiaceae bacterium]